MGARPDSLRYAIPFSCVLHDAPPPAWSSLSSLALHLARKEKCPCNDIKSRSQTKIREARRQAIPPEPPSGSHPNAGVWITPAPSHQATFARGEEVASVRPTIRQVDSRGQSLEAHCRANLNASLPRSRLRIALLILALLAASLFASLVAPIHTAAPAFSHPAPVQIAGGGTSGPCSSSPTHC